MTFNPITIVVAGLGVALVGAAWVAASLLGRGKGGWATPLALAGASGAATGLWAVDESLGLAALALAAASLLFAVLRSGLPQRLARAAARPQVQAALLVAAGMAVAWAGLNAIDADLQKEIAETAKAMNEASVAVDLGPSGTPAARTDRGRSVELWLPSAGSLADLHTFSKEEYVRRNHLESHLIQTGPVDGGYNCHGWVFAAGKFWVRGTSVETILKDNGYRTTKRPAIGDLCVYRDEKGEVSHSAVVRGLGAKGLVLLESKWGRLGRYIHEASENNAYKGHSTTYYRTRRGSHVLAGVADAQPELFAGAE